ncbi:MAG TPA: TonB-dependent receptor [Gemmatimonadaceae bacterium]|jgi:hypothetical protein
MRSFVSKLAISALIALSSARSNLLAQTTDVLRGHVTGPDTTSLAGATVRATSYSGGVSKTATADRSGRYTIVFLNGEGDYWLDVIKIGFAPKRFEVKRIGDEEILIADAKMSEVVEALSTTEVTAQSNRAKPSRTAASVDVGGGERPLTNTNVAADEAGNLAAMAATVAGFQLVPGLDGAPDMYSLLGLSGDQNNTTFNGLGSAIDALPPDILATTSISPYTFDPSKGGFSGGQISIQTVPGSNFSQRAITNVDITPPLEWADATAAAQDQKYTNLRVGGNALGPLALDKAFYNVAYNVGRRFSDAQTLLNTGSAGLTAAGVSPDSVARLLAILGAQGVPPTEANVPGLQSQDVFQASSNFDFMPSASGAGHSFTLGALVNYQRAQPVSRGGLLLTTPAHGGEATQWGANLSLVHSNYFWFGILTKTTIGFAGSGTSSAPYVDLPNGTVRVSSLLPNGNSSIKALSFGGSSSLSSLEDQTFQVNNQLSWYSTDNHHTLKLTSGVAHDAFSSDATPSLLGSFAYNSLADVADGTPSSFSRTLTRNTQTGNQLTGAASFGDYWRPTPNVQIQYGLRLDASRFMSAPAFNEALFEAFGTRNNAMPNRAYLSPRVGMQWYYGDSPKIAYAPGSARPPRAVVHAGIGMFQNIASSQLIAPAVNATGLPNSARTISCVGDAVPLPDWSDFLADPGTIPTQCADGTSGTVFSTSAPNVTLFDSRYRQPQSLRAAADWSSAVLDNRFVLGLQTIASFGSAQIGLVDINLNPTTRFSLANEGERPVFVDPRAIVSGTGVVSTVGSRVSPAFQEVLSERSELHVNSRQLTVNLKPVTANRFLKWNLTYNLLDANESYYGFSSTVSNPFDRDWGPSLLAVRNAVTLQWSDVPIADVIYVSAVVRLSSGQRYTPMIAGDINGDGVQNDRAFIFGPNSVADTSVASAMRSLLASSTPSVRDCLEKQLGQLATRGSCQAPWNATTGLAIKFNPQKIGLPKRATITFTVQNPLGLVDLAVYGSDNVHGWGQIIPPDQNLLFVRGFDPASREFKYEVNQRFGSTRPQQSATHTLPFMSLGVKLDVGPTRERQALTQRLDFGRGRPGTKQGAEALKSLAISSIPNPMSMILDQADSLRLTRVQADSIAWLSHTFTVFTDSVWTPVASSFAALPDNYSTDAAYDRYVSARERTVDYLLTLVPHVTGLLTPSQRRKLPPQVANFLDERVLKFLRSSSAGDNSAVLPN